jgi:tripartite-type tricarboxylate transporter receptor subunit TctC
MHFARSIWTAAVLAGLPLAGAAQEYPSQPVRIVVPTSGGGSSDTVGRVIAERLRERLGQPVIVDNRPGAGQMIGAEHVAKAVADGYTLGFFGGTYTTSIALRARLPFDPVKDLTGVARAGEGAFMLAVHPSLPAKSARDLIALARARPGQMNFGSAGTGSITHLVGELFAGMAKINVTHVPYKSGPPAATDLVGGHIEMLYGSLPLLMHHAKSGRIRALGVTSAKRFSLAPDLPTLAETGVPGYEAMQGWGMLAPAKTPSVVIARLNREINAILATDEVTARLATEGATPSQLSPDAFSASIRTEIANWRKIVKDLKMALQ